MVKRQTQGIMNPSFIMSEYTPLQGSDFYQQEILSNYTRNFGD